MLKIQRESFLWALNLALKSVYLQMKESIGISHLSLDLMKLNLLSCVGHEKTPYKGH